MKIIACNGSPRKEWNTAMQLKNALDRLLQFQCIPLKISSGVKWIFLSGKAFSFWRDFEVIMVMANKKEERV